MVPPAQTSGLSSPVILSDPGTDSTRRRKVWTGQKVGKERSVLEPAGPVSIFQSLVSPGTKTSPHPAERWLLVTWISPRCQEHCLGCSAQCHLLWLNFSILWTFDPSPALPLGISSLSSLFTSPFTCAAVFPPEVCQTLSHLFGWPCSGRNSQQEGGTTKAFLFVCLCCWHFFFPQTFSSLLSSSLPTIKLVAMLRRQT